MFLGSLAQQQNTSALLKFYKSLPAHIQMNTNDETRFAIVDANDYRVTDIQPLCASCCRLRPSFRMPKADINFQLEGN
jgi:hypothetical protein